MAADLREWIGNYLSAAAVKAWVVASTSSTLVATRSRARLARTVSGSSPEQGHINMGPDPIQLGHAHWGLASPRQIIKKPGPVMRPGPGLKASILLCPSDFRAKAGDSRG